MAIFFFIFFIITIICSEKKDLQKENKRNLQNTLSSLTESNKYENIRIYVNYHCLLGTTDSELLIQAIENARQTLEKLIKVKRLENKILLQNFDQYLSSSFIGCAGDLKNYEEADLFIFIRKSSEISSGVLDFDTPEIFYHFKNDRRLRPILGGVTFASDTKTFTDGSSTHQALSTIFLHEFTHILGFNKTLMEAKDLIKNEDTTRRMNDKPYKKSSFIGPHALEKARLYFNCPEIDSIELDTANGKELKDNNNTIHWHSRILMGDYMTPGLYYIEQAISEITLAALVDLGYYEVNYYTGGLMRFGKNKGCKFLNSKQDCIEEYFSYDPNTRILVSGLTSAFPNEFCSSIYQQNNETFGVCSPGRQSMAFCFNGVSNIHINNNVKNYIRNFRYGNTIGSGFSPTELIEFCPYSNSDINTITPKYDYNGYCNFGNSQYGEDLPFLNDESYTKISAYIYEEYSNNSFCAFSSVLNNDRTDNPDYIKGILRPTCYKMFCSEKSLTIKIGDEFIVCPRKGGPIKIDSTDSKNKGYLICPDYNLICTGTKMCNNLFDCVQRESLVKNSTFSYDYENFPAYNISIEIKTITDSSLESEIIDEELFELGDEGICPKFCKQCNSNKQCAICGPDYPYYIGVSEEDNEEIKCSGTPPQQGYYYYNKDNKHYYYKCIENCITCEKNTKDKCIQCVPSHYVNSSTGKCDERIPGCIEYDTSKVINRTDNGNAPSYNECLSCNNSANYYCFDMHRETCNKTPSINLSLYGDMEDKDFSCIQKCDERFMNCETCNRTSCFICNQTKHFINNYGNCIKEIENCKVHHLNVNYSSCAICNESFNYYCINDTRSKCEYISPLSKSSYYKISNNYDSCVQLCEVKYTDLCLECNNTGCTKCREGFFIHQGRCYQNMTGCIDNKIISLSPETKECNECDKINNYYCINKTRTKCFSMEQTEMSAYYLLPNISYPCYGLCEEIFKHCLECNSTNCFSCSPPYAINRKRLNCLLPPKFFREDEKCQIITSNSENLNKDLDFGQLVDNYFYDIDHISKVEHFVGKDFTMTLYINSNCTDGLLSKGYYAIDTRELNKTIIDESDYDFNFHLLGIYINHNYRSFIQFYDLEKNDINLNTDCPTCFEKNYIMTHNLYNILKEIIGTPFSELVIERELNIFDGNEDIYTDRCTNMTLYQIDIPIHLRKNYLLLDEYNIDPLICRDEDCELLEYNLKNRTSTCRCRVKNNFNYLFQKNDIQYTLYNIKEEAKGISEASKAISCMKKGIKYSNFKNNDVAIVILVFFILQFVCYIAYGCFGKPLANISNLPSIMQTLANPPKMEDTFRLYLFADWNLNLSNSTKKDEPIDEEEKVIQPRDDSGDQIMEEEKSFNNDFFSDISIDTNAGGLYPDKRTNRSLRALEKSKKVLILLGNKLKKKMSIEHSLNKEEVISDSDEVPLSKRKKIDNSSFLKNYWLFLSIKQHIINYFSELSCCNITISYIPLELRFVRSIFLFILSIVITILWLDQKYFEKKWEHFNDKYFLSSTLKKDFEISLGERISYALGHNIGNAIVNLIFLIVADFLVGILFFNLRNDVGKIQEKGKMSKMQDYVLKVRRNYNIFYALNFILIVVFFLSLCGFGVEYPGGVADCLTVAIFSVFLLEIVPFVWALILAALRYFGYKKKKKTLVTFSEYFLY